MTTTPELSNKAGRDLDARQPRSVRVATSHGDGGLGELAPIYALADHLDATLAMTEDLLELSLTTAPLAAGDGTATIARRHQAIAEFARAARALELGITARLLQARARAIEVRPLHPRFEPLIALLIGGTAPLADAAGEDGGLGDITADCLLSGPAVLTFLSSRALIDGEARSLAPVTTLQASEDYLLAGGIHLGALMDMIAQFLDSLELAFDLYATPCTVN